MRNLILRHPEPDDPFDEWDANLDRVLNSELPPEAYKDPDDLVIEELLASIEEFNMS